MNTMTVTSFKAHALEAIAGISESKEPLTLTKRGVPIVTVIPYPTAEVAPSPGSLSDMLAFENDIISPLGEDMWDSAG